MTEQGSSRPRRALGPLEPDQDDRAPSPSSTAPDSSRLRWPSRAFPPDADAPDSDTQILRRLAASPTSPESPASPASPPEVTTPVPPPAPVLPESGRWLAASAGRRFSASAEPSEFAGSVPRRSAVSAGSPNLPEDLAPRAGRWALPPNQPVPPLTPIVRPVPLPGTTSASAGDLPGISVAGPPAPGSGTPAATVSLAKDTALAPPVQPGTPVPGAAAHDATEAGPDFLPGTPVPTDAPGAPIAATGWTDLGPAPVQTRRSPRRALWLIVGVLVIALVVAAVVWALGQGTPNNAAGVQPTVAPGSPSASLDPLVTPEDAAALGGTWTLATAAPAATVPICLEADGASPDRVTQRELTGSNSTGPTSLLHAVESYADATAAETAYTAWLTQLSGCVGVEANVGTSWTVFGLADTATATEVVVQAADGDRYHTVLISRTGRTVSLADLTSSQTGALTDLLPVVAASLTRICGGGDGTCPSSPSPTETLPLPTEPAGWLVEADLPRITPGSGRWAATPPTTALTVFGTQCETVDLKDVPGASGSSQRTLVLADDPVAPQGFGVDQVVYTFPSRQTARDFYRDLNTSLSGCAERMSTATVAAGPKVSGDGAGAISYTGVSYEITQKTNATDSVPFRVAVLRVDTKVVYLVANPSADFDFATAQWRAVMARAGLRATQG